MTNEYREDPRGEDQAASVDRIRKTLAEGFAFVRGQEKVSSISSLTIEDMINRDLARIVGDETDIRPGRLSQLSQLRTKVNEAVDQAKRLPRSAFEISENSSVANTDADGEGPVEAPSDEASDG